MLEVVSKRTPNENDPLSLSLDELAKVGAKKLLSAALELEVQEYIDRCSHLKDSNVHQSVVRNGKGKERTILLGSGEVRVEAPRVNDKRDNIKYLQNTPSISTYISKRRISIANTLS